MTVLRHAAHGCCYSVAALQSVAIAVIASTSATSASNRIRSMWSGDRDRQIVVDRVITKGALGNARADCRVRALLPCRSVGPHSEKRTLGWLVPSARERRHELENHCMLCFFFLCALLVSTFFFLVGCLGCGGRMKSKLGFLLPDLLPGFYGTRLLLCRLGC